MKCLRCHATFLKSEALELESPTTIVSYERSKTYACPFCKSQYHFEREPAVTQGAEPSSLLLSNSLASKSVEQVQAATQPHREPSEVNSLVHFHRHSVKSTIVIPMYSVCAYMHMPYYLHTVFPCCNGECLYCNATCCCTHVCMHIHTYINPSHPQQPESTEISDAAEAVPPLECTPSMADEDPTLQLDSDPTTKGERATKALLYDTHFMQSNFKVHFEFEVFKEDGECLKEALMVRCCCVWVFGDASDSSILTLQVSVVDRSGNAAEANQVVVFSNRMVYFCNISNRDLYVKTVMSWPVYSAF